MKRFFLVFLFFAILIGTIQMIAYMSVNRQIGPHVKEDADDTDNYYYHVDAQGRSIGFDLLDPQLSPPEIHDSVMLGYNIMRDTPKCAPMYSGNALRCVNCHFCAGNTLGGKNGGISLVGVTATYPRYSNRAKKTITLSDRIGNCFARSLNGKAPPQDSKVMKSIIAYLEWISKEAKDCGSLPWLGLKPLESKHKPNDKHGAIVYQDNCASCHNEHGEGSKAAPPVWGFGSFNDGASFHKVPILASFIFWNMPYGDANLSEEEALDVACFIHHQQRAHYEQQ